MLTSKVGSASAVIAIVVSIAVAVPSAQRSTSPKVTSPKEQFGRDIGDDYFLVNYTHYVEYLRKLDQQSDRMTVIEIGSPCQAEDIGD